MKIKIKRGDTKVEIFLTSKQHLGLFGSEKISDINWNEVHKNELKTLKRINRHVRTLVSTPVETFEYTQMLNGDGRKLYLSFMVRHDNEEQAIEKASEIIEAIAVGDLFYNLEELPEDMYMEVHSWRLLSAETQERSKKSFVEFLSHHGYTCDDENGKLVRLRKCQAAKKSSE